MENKDLSKEMVLNELRAVMDPEFGYSIVDMGLVYDVEITETLVLVEYTLTHEGCPYGPMIEESIFFVLNPLTDKTIYPELVWEPAWDSSKLNDEIKLELGFPI